MSRTLSTEQRLEAIAEVLYPIEAGMCLNRRQQIRTNRVVWVRQTLKTINGLGENMQKTVLDELENKKGDQP